MSIHVKILKLCFLPSIKVIQSLGDVFDQDIPAGFLTKYSYPVKFVGFYQILLILESRNLMTTHNHLGVWEN